MSVGKNSAHCIHPLKSGTLSVCVKGILSKSWVDKQCLLYPEWGGQPARIEILDLQDNGHKADRPWKVFSLQDLKRAVKKPRGKESQLEVVTRKEKLVLSSADEWEIQEWERFLKGLVTLPSQGDEDTASHGSSDQHSDDLRRSQEVVFEENVVYDSAEPKPRFGVTVEENEDARRLQLSGKYILQVNDFSLSLLDIATEKCACYWEYKFIRRYGRTPVLFSFESGRRCSTGSGWFSFRTTQGNSIFHLAQEKLEKMRQDDMISREIVLKQEPTEAATCIPRSISLDPSSRDIVRNRNSSPEKALLGVKPVSEIPQEGVVPSQISPKVHKKDRKSDKDRQKEEKERQKVEKERQKEEEKKQKELKAKQKSEKSKIKGNKTKGKKSGEEMKKELLQREQKKEAAPDHKVPVGQQVLPPVEQSLTKHLKHVEVNKNGKVRPTPPAPAAKPHTRLSGQLSNPETSRAVGSRPEDLYAKPEGMKTDLRPFTKPMAMARAPRLYEEPDLVVAPAKPHMEDCAYDEIEPVSSSQKPTIKPNSAANHNLYSEVGQREKAWEKHGRQTIMHVENYTKVPEGQGLQYKPQPVTSAKPGQPKPITTADLESDLSSDLYDHLQVQSTKPRSAHTVQAGQGTADIYAHADVVSSSMTMLPAHTDIQGEGHEYEETVLKAVKKK